MPTVNREEFLLALETVVPGIGKEENLDQSSRFLFRNGRVWTFDKDICCRIKTTLPKDFEAAVISKPMLDSLRDFPDDSVDVSRENGHVRVKGKKDWFKVLTDQEITLPISSVDKPGEWTILPQEFAEGIKLVKNCASTDKDIEIVNCVHVHPKYLEACDNYRYTRYRVKTPIENPVLVKSKSIRHVIDMGMNEISETENWLHFRNGAGLILSLRKSVEAYPDFSPFLELEEGSHKVVFPPGLKNKFKRANTFSREYADNNQVTVKLSPGRVTVTGTGVTGEYGGRAKVTYSGPVKEFVVHPDQFTELVENYDECEVGDTRIRARGDRYDFAALLKMHSNEETEGGEES
jgi:hypothetical protein